MSYKYFISYAHEEGFGDSLMIIDREIENYEHLEFIKDKIQEKFENVNNPIVLNFKLIGKSKGLSFNRYYVTADEWWHPARGMGSCLMRTNDKQKAIEEAKFQLGKIDYDVVSVWDVIKEEVIFYEKDKEDDSDE